MKGLPSGGLFCEVFSREIKKESTYVDSFVLSIELEGYDWVFVGCFEGRVESKDDSRC